MKYAQALLAYRRHLIRLIFYSRVAAVAGTAVLTYPVAAFAALEFFSIKDNAVVMYDAPSLKADKLYVASRHLPVEAVVKVEGWVKVRDSGGTLAWVEEKELSEKRYVIVTAPQAEAYQAANVNSPLVFQAQQNVVMELLEPAANGWVKVRHRDGQVGYIRTNQVWGS
ncbi:SH3 domain-containing protein [Nitrosovibrio tenuis]|uniref:SH3-like domain-containing protein n=1 Tax=Nitrosovibrio tenuis TaxID=1233 RepID=A0A1H7QJE6_9PROT|nr:SH3 domain-containing protein [Nitrosovibrio tenuis]SEL48033.1 SH3-like domain-containing protein [Nitrosovibrio tenuis]